jgi:hypothetical protein
MIADAPFWNFAGGILLAVLATLVLAEFRSTSLIPKSLFLWPLFTVLVGIVTLIQGWYWYGFLSIFVLHGTFLILSGIQAALVNIRRLNPWPSGAVWLGLVLTGLGFQFYPLFFQRVMGFLWVAVGVTKVLRERSTTLEGGTPLWVWLLYVQAILLAAYR